VLTAPEALAKLGAPPPKLQKLVHPAAWVAVARISGRPVVAIFDRQGGGGWMATGIHD
jgi:hypothetical protein